MELLSARLEKSGSQNKKKKKKRVWEKLKNKLSFQLEQGIPIPVGHLKRLGSIVHLGILCPQTAGWFH